MEESGRRRMKAEELVETTMAGRDASHDAAHAFRVRDLALSLAFQEGLHDPHSLEVVSYFSLVFSLLNSFLFVHPRKF